MLYRHTEIKNNKKCPGDKLPEENSSLFPKKSVRIGTTISKTKQGTSKSIKKQIGCENPSGRATPENFSPLKNFSPIKETTKSFSPVKPVMKFGSGDSSPNGPMRNPE